MLYSPAELRQMSDEDLLDVMSDGIEEVTKNQDEHTSDVVLSYEGQHDFIWELLSDRGWSDADINEEMMK